jgi:hypothetical protein
MNQSFMQKYPPGTIRKPEELFFEQTQSALLKQRTLNIDKQTKLNKIGNPKFADRLIDTSACPRAPTVKQNISRRGKLSFQSRERYSRITSPQPRVISIANSGTERKETSHVMSPKHIYNLIS